MLLRTRSAFSSARAPRPLALALLAACLFAGAALLHTGSAQAQHVTTAKQRAVANKVAQEGVPLSALAPNAPDSYTVKSGDTLWAISRIFLKSPWRWPELWGMNKAQIRNPHLIFPGQVLYLDKSNGRARLRFGRPGGNDGGLSGGTIRVSPQTRYTSLADAAVRPIPNSLIEPFLNRAIIVEKGDFDLAPRFVGHREDGRVLLAKGDRGYVRPWRAGDLNTDPGSPRTYRVYRSAKPLLDPDTKEVLAYEARYLGVADLVRPAGRRLKSNELNASATLANKPTHANPDVFANVNAHYPEKDPPVTRDPAYFGQGGVEGEYDIIPATVDIKESVEEIVAGDRLAPDEQVPFIQYVPHAAPPGMRARVISLYSDGVDNAAQNQIVAINKGSQDGIEIGHVFTLLSDGRTIRDYTTNGKPEVVKLPNEQNGSLMVFSVFDRVSYGLVLEILEPVSVGDHLMDPGNEDNPLDIYEP